MSPKTEVTGTVRAWYSEEGWGVLVSPDLEGTAFAHFSAVDMPGYRDLQEGQPVQFQYETPGQDGCDHRATYVKLLP
jgi:CspA family cold shock protein